ncbi:MAG: SDR family oxidoreductase [Pyrinomonadaceae bacterium]
MNVLIFGGNGMLGHQLVKFLGNRHEVWSTIRGEFASIEQYGIFDETRTIRGVKAEDNASVRRAISTANPDIVINAIGIIKQLPSSKDFITTLTVNSIFPHRLAELSEEFGFRLITVSTDCVFDGVKGNYSEVDVPNATDLYGKSKNLGEVTYGNCLTLRTSIIGRELGTVHSLVEWFMSNRGKTLKGFVNAIYSGFPTVVFADIIAGLIENNVGLSGLYHVSSDPINKFDLLTLIKAEYDLDIEIERYEDFKIDRSLDSTRFRKATGFRPPAWNDMIKAMAEN